MYNSFHFVTGNFYNFNYNLTSGSSIHDWLIFEAYPIHPIWEGNNINIRQKFFFSSTLKWLSCGDFAKKFVSKKIQNITKLSVADMPGILSIFTHNSVIEIKTLDKERIQGVVKQYD